MVLEIVTMKPVIEINIIIFIKIDDNKINRRA